MLISKSLFTEDECQHCIHCVENAHYGCCGDISTGYCNLMEKPVDLNNNVCDKAEFEDGIPDYYKELSGKMCQCGREMTKGEDESFGVCHSCYNSSLSFDYS